MGTETQGLSYVAKLGLDSETFWFQSLFCITGALEKNSMDNFLFDCHSAESFHFNPKESS